MRAAMLTSAGIGAGLVYATQVRPWMRRWGTTADESGARLPGDDVVPAPQYVSTHGVTVVATAEAVWPWLVQMGQGRGGLYSYDRLENLVGCDMHSADRIVPELQQLDVGDEIRLYPPGGKVDLRYVVRDISSEHHLVLGAPGTLADALDKGLPYPSWTFVLRPIDDRSTRLLARFRSQYRADVRGAVVNHYGLEPVHFLMERRMLLGIAARAERLAIAADACRP